MKKNNHIGHIVFMLSVGLTLLFSSCTMRPSSVLSNRKMVNILVDLHTAEGVLQAGGYNYGHDDDVNGYYAVILEQHGVTQAEFDSSIVWYTIHPQFFQRVYPKVVKRLQERYDAETALLAAQDAELKSLLAAQADSISMAESAFSVERYYLQDGVYERGDSVAYYNPSGLRMDPALATQETLFRQGYPRKLYQPLVFPLCTDTIEAIAVADSTSVAEN